jgi:hypothetical protein
LDHSPRSVNLRFVEVAMMKACPNCATAFDPLQGRYAPDGSVVCVPCGEKLASAKQATEKKSAGSAFVGACGAVLIALASYVVQLRIGFFAMPLIALVFGGGTAYTALRHPNAREMLGWKRLPTAVLGGLSILLAVGSLIVNAP